jgi:hypothetical protein
MYGKKNNPKTLNEEPTIKPILYFSRLGEVAQRRDERKREGDTGRWSRGEVGIIWDVGLVRV